MKLTSRRLLDELLVAEEQCLAAAFCTYTFDPRFFEDQVLRTLMRLRSDPEENAAMYHDEARTALQATPVAVIVDASVRQAGRRLPYDQLLVRSRTFHPKLAIALYDKSARVLVGSCNLTRGGYDENAELVFTRTLYYAEPADALTLRAIDSFLAASVALADCAGTQTQLVRDELARRLPRNGDLSSVRESDHVLLSSIDRPILDQLFEMIPSDFKITRVGVLALFYERDDAAAGTDDGIRTFLSAIVEQRSTHELAVDLGTAWENAPVAPPAGPAAVVKTHLGRCWAWRWSENTEHGPAERLEYFVPTGITEKNLQYRDSMAVQRRIERSVVDEALAEKRLWPVTRPSVPLPARVVESLASRYQTRLWLHPAASLSPDGRVQRRPLHAKLFLLCGTRRGRTRTWILMGSPNASKGAMLRSSAAGGNVELAVLTVVDEELTLPDFLPTLVAFDANEPDMIEREMPTGGPDMGAWITDAVHAARARDLHVHWASDGPAPLAAWKLRYNNEDIASGCGPSSTATVVFEFDLLPSTAELTLVCGEAEYVVPIRVADLAELPTSSALAKLSLRELLALLGRRIGQERLAMLRTDRGATGVDALLTAVFGEGFGPVDVFKAWWGIAHDLSEPLSVPAFRQRLCGPLGVVTVWDSLRREASAGLGADDVWVYGCELLKTMREVTLPEGPDQAAKRELLDLTCAGIRTSVSEVRPAGRGKPWLDDIDAFYAKVQSHA